MNYELIEKKLNELIDIVNNKPDYRASSMRSAGEIITGNNLYKDNFKSKFSEMIDNADITKSYRDWLLQLSDILYLSGCGWNLMNALGLDFKSNDYGVFDKKKSGKMEKDIILIEIEPIFESISIQKFEFNELSDCINYLKKYKPWFNEHYEKYGRDEELSKYYEMIEKVEQRFVI